MTVDALISKINQNLEAIEQSEIPMVIAVKDIIADMAIRIFQEGKNSSGTQIGVYDTTKEIYADDASLPKKGTNIGKRGKKIKTSYYANYKELRKQQGRESEFVNLSLFNRLHSEFINKPIGIDGKVTGDVGEPIRSGEFEYVIKFSDDGMKKYNNIKKKYGKVFSPTKEELEKFSNVFLFELKQRLLND